MKDSFNGRLIRVPGFEIYGVLLVQYPSNADCNFKEVCDPRQVNTLRNRKVRTLRSLKVRPLMRIKGVFKCEF